MRLCVIGDPVGHSLSPRIHRRFMERCGAAGSYEAVTVTAETLEDLVVQGRRGAWDGCNVTMPLKERILPLLTEEEQAVFRRGRNSQVHTIPPHASRAQYAQATALEALLGWLYLRGQRQRINELFAVMMEE